MQVEIIDNLCKLVNYQLGVVNPNEIHDTKKRELLDFFLEGTIGSEGAEAIQLFKTTGSKNDGFFRVYRQIPKCDSEEGTGNLCVPNSVTLYDDFETVGDKIDLKDFQKRTSKAFQVKSEGTLRDFCKIVGKNEALQQFANKIKHAAWSLRVQLDRDLAKVLANNVGNYPDGTPFNPAAPETLTFYGYDTDINPPQIVINPSALAVVEADLDVINDGVTRRAIGNRQLKGVANVLKMSPVFGSMAVPSLLNDMIVDVEIPPNPTLNRPLLYISPNNAINVLTWVKSINRTGTAPMEASDVETYMTNAIASDMPKYDRKFPVRIDGLTYDLHMQWEKCGDDLTVIGTLEMYTYLHVPKVTNCNGINILAYDVPPIEKAKPVAPTPTPNFDYLCIDFAPVTDCADYITGDYTLTLPDSSIITGSVSGNANVTTENGIFALLQSIFAKNTIAGIVRNKCGDYMLTAMVNGYAFASGDVVTLNFPCLAAPILITVANCTDCNCVVSEAYASSITATIQGNALVITPTFALTGLTITSYDWSTSSDTGGFVFGATNLHTFSVTDVSTNDGMVIYRLDVTLSNGSIIKFTGRVALLGGAITTYMLPVISRSGSNLVYDSVSNIVANNNFELEAPNGTVVYTTPSVVPSNTMVGTFAVAGGINSTYKFSTKDGGAEGYYNCKSQGGGLLRQPAPVKRSVEVAPPIAAPKTKAKVKA